MRFLFACGGTAGHINPALAIAEELRSRNAGTKILFVGANRALEKTLVPRAGFHIVNIKMSGVRRGFSPKKVIYNIKTVKNLIAADFSTSNLLKRFKPDVVIGTGGYVCYPVLKKAAKMKIPTVVHESNALPGLTTKLLSRFVDKVLVSFPDKKDEYIKPERVVFTGTPVREEFKSAKSSNYRKNTNDKPLVLSFWGSLGAENMNEVIADVIKINVTNRLFSHIHAAGSLSGVNSIREKLNQAGIADISSLEPEIVIKEYIDDMPSKMAGADLVICRSGGSSVAELIELMKPAVLIPSPYVVNNEQKKNSLELTKVGGAIQLDEESLSGEKLYDTVASLLSEENKLEKMSENLKSLSAPYSTDNIADIILSLCK